VEQALVHLTKLDGVMIGRAAYQEPWRLLDVDPALFGTPAPVTSVRMAAEAMIAYLERETAAGIRASCILRHVVGLFHRVPGARAFRRHLSIASVKPGAGAEVLRDALRLITGSAARAETAAA
jgi:tRNA-dihydrouridine synthase A